MATNDSINLLIILIVSGRQYSVLIDELKQQKFYFTQVDSSGGVMHEPTECLFIGLNEDRLPALLDTVRRVCKPQTEYLPTNLNLYPGGGPLPMVAAQIGGAQVYMMHVERFQQL